MERNKKIVDFPNRELIHEQAGSWIVRMDRAPLDEFEKKELREWINQSMLHRKIFLNMLKIWDCMYIMQDLAELLPLDDISRPKPAASPSSIAMASLAFILLVIVFLYTNKDIGQHPSKNISSLVAGPEIYSTKVGDVKVIHLADGSIITLNTDTRVEAEITNISRDIHLLSGEVFFHVKHDKNTPFMVSVDNTMIKAVGTAFSVRKLPDFVEVTVMEGLVKVTKNRAVPKHQKIMVDNGIVLKANQVVQVGPSKPYRIQDINPDQIARKLLWQQKMLAFNNDPMQKVINEFSRYTNLKLVIADQETAAIRVGGYFRSDDIPGLFTSLEENFSIAVTQTAADTFLLQERKNNL
jgi:transmembrane sensor